VTGTDGKTTTSTLIHKIMNDHVGKTLLISTAAIKIGDQEIFNEKKMTSLDVYDLQATLTTARDNGCKIAVIEVSSHGLDQYRFEGVDFDMGVLTNITPEHLDYHGTFANYVAAKKKLFQYVLNNPKKNKMAVLPKDDETGRKWFDTLSFDKAINF
jgi:UDP-N-acetylmuramoyl-L-alanyl-D-glutamate--2,6-diaminopimelate ligase